MIPGPLTARPGPRPEPHPQPQGDGPSAGAGGPSFADLLSGGAALQEAVGPAAASTDATVFERLDAAQVFNQTGLFRGAVPLSAEASEGEPSIPLPNAQRGPAPELSAAAPNLGAMGSQAAAARATDLSSPATATVAAISKAVGRHGPALRSALAHGRNAAPALVSQRVPEGGEARSGSRQGLRHIVARLVEANLGKGASTAAQVNLHVAEGGVTVAVRADRLSREQRDRLRAEIGELLARHGFESTAIILNGEAAPGPQGRND
jgi:hypothetical protein